MPGKREEHPEDDPLNPFNPEMWADQNKPHERTDADAMFGALLDMQDEFDKDNPNIVGRARHESTAGHELKREPARHELDTAAEAVAAELPQQAERMIHRFFSRLFRKG